MVHMLSCVLVVGTDPLASIHSGAPAPSTQPQNVVLACIIAAAIKEYQEGSTTEDELD